MNIADVCTRRVVTADKDASLQQAAALMREQHVGTLVVVAEGPEGVHAVGIVTDRDVVIEGVARGLDVTQTPVGQLAEGKLAVVRAQSTLDEALEMSQLAHVARAGMDREAAERAPLPPAQARSVRIPAYSYA